METHPKSPAALSIPASHFSFRDDVTVDTIREQVSKHHRLRLLDCGCGDGSLLTAIARAGLPVNRIHYYGLDQNEHRLKLTRAHAQLAGYELLDLRVRELPDLAGYTPSFFEAIVVNNILHELPAELLPRFFKQLDSLLARPSGVLCIVDMEALPPEDPFEPWAIMWTASEVEKLLRAGNWSPQLSTHPKRVTAYKVVVGPTEHVDLGGMVNYLKAALTHKKRCLLDDLAQRRASGDIGEDVLRLTATLASVMVSRRALEKWSER